MPEQTDPIRVVVRVRPLNQNELQGGSGCILSCSQDNKTVNLLQGPGGTGRQFAFSACFNESTTQHAFYEDCGVKRLLDSALDGYSATVFAYGQTGSGKTYTVSGKEDIVEGQVDVDPSHSALGISPRAIEYLFGEAMSRVSSEEGLSITMRASCLEIYNEQVIDLLNPESGPLNIRENAGSHGGGFFVENLFVVECEGASDALEVFKEGIKNRRVASHDLNADSSRSHSIFTIYIDGVRQVRDGAEGTQLSTFGKISFVDLAGSERLKVSKSSGEMVKETGSINKSLFNLGNVISALDKGESYIPYRDSKLTKLLSDSLGGESMTLMIACCSPSSQHLEETTSTLHYASRAKNIQNKPIIQMDPREKTILLLRQEIALLRGENQELKGKLGISMETVRRSPFLGKEGGIYSDLRSYDQYERRLSVHSEVSRREDGAREGSDWKQLPSSSPLDYASENREFERHFESLQRSAKSPSSYCRESPSFSSKGRNYLPPLYHEYTERTHPEDERLYETNSDSLKRENAMLRHSQRLAEEAAIKAERQVDELKQRLADYEGVASTERKMENRSLNAEAPFHGLQGDLQSLDLQQSHSEGGKIHVLRRDLLQDDSRDNMRDIVRKQREEIRRLETDKRQLEDYLSASPTTSGQLESGRRIRAPEELRQLQSTNRKLERHVAALQEREQQLLRLLHGSANNPAVKGQRSGLRRLPGAPLPSGNRKRGVLPSYSSTLVGKEGYND